MILAQGVKWMLQNVRTGSRVKRYSIEGTECLLESVGLQNFTECLMRSLFNICILKVTGKSFDNIFSKRLKYKPEESMNQMN